MSVLIRGMDVPKNCGTCFLRVGGCKQRMYMEQRPKSCPLIELPPHGRLIDADALQPLYVQIFGKTVDMIQYAPTVIEAEEVTE